MLQISLQLLSLRGRGQVLIHKVQLVVSEDVEGVSTDPRCVGMTMCVCER